MSSLVLRYATQKSPFGPITVVESDRGVVRIDFAEPDLERLARRFGENARFERRARLKATTELARRVGKPKASRAIGVAMATNPIPIIVPCHRVVAADGSLGGFSSGLELKRKLHAHEGIGELRGGWEPSRRYAT